MWRLRHRIETRRVRLTRYWTVLLLLFAAPWLTLCSYLDSAPRECLQESEVLVLAPGREPIRSRSRLLYRQERNGPALLHINGELQIGGPGQRRRFIVSRSATLDVAFSNGRLTSRTLWAGRSFSDDASDELVYRYVHPALQTNAYYHAQFFRLDSAHLAAGTEFGVRTLCSNPPSG